MINRMKNILYAALLLPLAALGQSLEKNYVKTVSYKDDTPSPQTAVQISYLDGLGRPVQQRAHQQSNTGKDIVTAIEYDHFGRQAREYLPYASGQASLAYSDNAAAETFFFYADGDFSSTGNPDFETTLYPYSEKLFESSPLSRVLQQSAPGDAWALPSQAGIADHTVKFEYLANLAKDDVKNFRATATWNASQEIFDVSISYIGIYAPGKLYKTVTRDENWTSGKEHTVEEFKNVSGQVVLKRTYEGGLAHDTYYVHDQYGKLSYVIPPLAGGAIGQQVLDNLCYQYRYDYRNRLVEKKLPGKQWEFVVYDRLDRVVATGPSNSPFSNLTGTGWLITKYDSQNRPVLSGWLAQAFDAAARKNLQALRNAQTAGLSETKPSSATDQTVNGVSFRYSNLAWPTSGYHVLSVSYYDDYNFPHAAAIPAALFADSSQPVYYNATIKPKGLATGSWVRAVTASTATNASKSYVLYDRKGIAVRNYTANHLGGYTQTDSKVDFTGKTLYTLTTHKRLGTDQELSVREAFAYSDQDRLVSHTHQVGNGPVEMLASNEYDELGQLIAKGVGNLQSSAQRLQQVNYSYSVRGWLKGINSMAGLEQAGYRPDLFAFGIGYDTASVGISGVEGLYNGNISETHWRSGSDNVLRSYGYRYDALNRLTDAFYKRESLVTNGYNEHISYDPNGNITMLQRFGGLDEQNISLEIDNLGYRYGAGSNRLLAVGDASGSPEGFSDGTNSGDDFAYDASGNMISDKNKNITSVAYNHLDLPVRIVFGGDLNTRVDYAYDALGAKLQKTVVQYNPVGDHSIVLTSVTDYLGFQYKDGVLQFFPTSEGYVSHTKGSYSYVYNYTDHLGNVRMSYTKNPANPSELKIIEESHYYPFGLKHQNYNSEEFLFEKKGSNLQLRAPAGGQILPYQYKYNGKEFQDELGLNLYDYGARNYDPAIGRWMNIDPLAEIYHIDSPYAYVLNNPLSYIDPDGRRIIGVTKEDAGKVHNDLNDVFADTKFNNLRNLFTRGKKNDKVAFDKIDAHALKEALLGLVGDDLALAELVTGAINSNAEHKVEYVENKTNLSSEGNTAFNKAFSRIYTDNGIPVPEFPMRTGNDISRVGGEGYNSPTQNGSHSFIVNDIGTSHGDGRRSITTFHEIFGHGIASAKKTSDIINNQNAIRTENLVRRVLGIQEQRDGANHAGGKVFGPSELPTVKN